MNENPNRNPDVPPKSRAWITVLEVIGVRLRFVAILAATFAMIAYWDAIHNYWDKWTRPQAVAGGQLPAEKEFFCPMHPKVVRRSLEADGSIPKCPICGMPLSLRSKGELPPLPAGATARVQLSPERIEQAGVETVEIAYRPMTMDISTVGTVVYDESRLSRVVARTSGYVEKLYVDKTFVRVARGDPLAEIYSPDLYSTSQELLLAANGGGTKELAESARRRLQLFGVSDREIDAILQAGTALPRLVLRAPRSGRVTAKNIEAGARVEDGMTLLEIADLSAVWIEADVYEKDLAYVRKGQAVEASVEAIPNRVFAGKAALVYPQLDAATRTNRVRLAMANPGEALRPGMYATVRIHVPLDEIEPFKSRAAKDATLRMATAADGRQVEEALAVPERAVIDTGAKQIVYVERRPGVFEGVEAQLGPRNGDFYAVAGGLSAGDRVAAAGAFLIDAETRLNPAAAGYLGAQGGPSARPSAGQSPKASDSRPPPLIWTEEQLKNLAALPAADRAAARRRGDAPSPGCRWGRWACRSRSRSRARRSSSAARAASSRR